MRPRLRAGDVLLVQGSRWIRVFTGESVSHVAVVCGVLGTAPRTRPHVVVTDYTLREGQRVMTLREWLRQYQGRRLWHGVAPGEVREHQAEIARAVRAWSAGPPEYAWWELPLIWWHQILGRPYRARGPQCHSYVYEIWRAAGYGEPPPRDPGDYLARCPAVYPLEV